MSVEINGKLWRDNLAPERANISKGTIITLLVDSNPTIDKIIPFIVVDTAPNISTILFDDYNYTYFRVVDAKFQTSIPLCGHTLSSDDNYQVIGHMSLPNLSFPTGTPEGVSSMFEFCLRTSEIINSLASPLKMSPNDVQFYLRAQDTKEKFMLAIDYLLNKAYDTYADDAFSKLTKVKETIQQFSLNA